ncbi:MAG: glycosyltransferase family 2 protein [Bacteroidetes bacterium]|nr:glycosyltransferase family 2 protein [Bacteroidota bacterium]
MKVSGFTIARNVVRADYPLREAVFSVLPLCHEFIIAVGKSEDETLEYVRSFDDARIKIIETIWDDSLREGGRVLAQETDKAKAAVSSDSDWLFYIQADECLHEKYVSNVQNAMEKHVQNPKVEGLLFDYEHFYGSYDYTGDSRKWYRREVRIIRNRPDIFSYRDAQGFRKLPNEKLQVAHCNAEIFHYGWVKHPREQQQKQMQFHRMWHDDAYMQKHVESGEQFDYSGIDSLAKFEGTHPAVMKERIQRMNWSFDYDISNKKFSLKNRFLYFVEKLTGWRPGEYKNYELLK